MCWNNGQNNSTFTSSSNLVVENICNPAKVLSRWERTVAVTRTGSFVNFSVGALQFFWGDDYFSANFRKITGIFHINLYLLIIPWLIFLIFFKVHLQSTNTIMRKEQFILLSINSVEERGRVWVEKDTELVSPKSISSEGAGVGTLRLCNSWQRVKRSSVYLWERCGWFTFYTHS